MCRWLAYLGEPMQVSTIVLDAQHSIVAQSLNSPLGAETVNGDGFGLGWYRKDAASGDEPSPERRLALIPTICASRAARASTFGPPPPTKKGTGCCTGLGMPSSSVTR